MSRHRDDDLAYGDYYEHGGGGRGGGGGGGDGDGQEGDRGIISDVGKRFFGPKDHTQDQTGGASFFDRLHNQFHDPLHDFVTDLKNTISGKDSSQSRPSGSYQGYQQQGYQQQGYQQQGAQPQSQSQSGQGYQHGNRFLSFAPERAGNTAKWYVDGCSYMYAVSLALERAQHSVWILDWWLSPELYLRRPPAKNQKYRIDMMLLAAAQRGVRVNIIVYKEVTQALTRKLLNPTLPDYLHSLLPNATDSITKGLTRIGLDVIFKSLEVWEETDPLIASPITVSSSHTKHALEDLHPNIGVFRHPDHLPDAAVLQSSFMSAFSNIKFTAASLSQVPVDGLKALYGAHDGTVMFWAHHEKLCLIDERIAFMGGLDLCYGRWDTNQHSIADAHPGNLDRQVFMGQDFNNARILDFQDVSKWSVDTLDRAVSARMGWSDVALCLQGPVVDDLRAHFTQRWNYIYDEKYSKKNTRYARLPDINIDNQQGRGTRLLNKVENKMEHEIERVEDFEHRHVHHQGSQQGSQQHQSGPQMTAPVGGINCQMTRSAAKWSHNLPTTEHSIQNAYCEIIRNSKQFVYIENQFFITATGDEQRPFKNQIGAAIVERILRAARSGQKYKMMVVMPAVPAFAGDLQSKEALGTRAIMEYQYNSINRGGHSIYQEIARAGFNPLDFIRFYNLRNYDRINASKVMSDAEKASGVHYEDASKGFDREYEGERGYKAYHPPPTAEYGVYEMDGSSNVQPGTHSGETQADTADYKRYQEEAMKIGSRKGLGDGRWDTVSECYMLNGEDIRNVPWEGGAMDEIDAFVSEELYIHSKLLIADDETVICGSANLNDRSQLGDHDSEIAVIIQDPEPVQSRMNGQPWRASKFATSLRREIFRKHLGLIKPQDMERPDSNYEPVGTPNLYDWGSEMDMQVEDPLSDEFQNLWNWQANKNSEAFEKVFHPVPSDNVKTWKEYDEFFTRYFGHDAQDKDKKKPSLYKWGHVVAENFSPGEAGAREVKEVLSTIKGNIVEMPLLFLKDEEDLAKEGVELNAFTEEIYT